MPDRMNYYFLLELSVEPPETDEARIRQALDAKQGEWTRKQSSNRDTQMLANLELLPDIREVMFNAAKRRDELARAEALLAQKYREFDMVLAGVASHGEVDEKVLPTLLNNLRFKPYGLTEALVRKHCPSLSSPQRPEQAPELPDSLLLDKMEEYLRVLGHKTLYTFLDKPASAECADLMAAASQAYQKASEMAQKTAQVTAQAKLAGISRTLFANPQAKQKYDYYVRLNQYPELIQAIRTAASVSDNALSTAAYENLLQLAQSQYRLEISAAGAYIKLCCAALGVDLGGNGAPKIVCASCNTANPPKSIQCANCHRPLKIQCPKCGAANENNAVACVQCSFSIVDREKALPYLQAANDALARGQIDRAGEALGQAASLWPGHPELNRLQQQYSELRGRQSALQEAIATAIEQKALCKARQLLNDARIAGVMVPAEQSAHVKIGLEKADALLNGARQADEETAFDLLLSAREVVTDYPALNALLFQYPPLPPERITVQVRGQSVHIQWAPSPSRGRRSYTLVRKQGAPPNHPNDGDAVYEGEGTAYIDAGTTLCTEYYYTVFARREGVFSVSGVHSDVLAVVPAVDQIRYIPGDRQLLVTWSTAPTVCGFRVIRTGTRSAPALINSVRPDGFQDTGLMNGTEYTYAVVAVHQLANRQYESDAVQFTAVPEAPAAAVTDLQVFQEDTSFVATWSADAAVQCALFASALPELAEGTLLDIRALHPSLTRLQVISQSAGEARFQLPQPDQYVTVLVYQGSYAKVGRYLRVTNLPSPAHLKGAVVDANTLCLTFDSWPENILRARVLFRTDDYPKGPQDAMAQAATFMREQYQRASGLMMRNLPHGDYYFCVYFGYTTQQSEILYSPPSKAWIAHREIKPVVYSVTYKKNLLGSGVLQFTLESETPVTLPPYQLVLRVGAPPIDRSTGFILHACNEATPVHEKAVLTLPYKPTGKNPCFVKMFFINPEDHARFALQTRASSFNP